MAGKNSTKYPSRFKANLTPICTDRVTYDVKDIGQQNSPLCLKIPMIILRCEIRLYQLAQSTCSKEFNTNVASHLLRIKIYVFFAFFSLLSTLYVVEKLLYNFKQRNSRFFHKPANHNVENSKVLRIYKPNSVLKAKFE